MGKPQSSRGGAEGRVTEPLSFGVTTVGVQRQVDRPALEPYAGQQGSDLTKIICRDPVPSHGGQYLDEYPRAITAGSQQFQIPQPGDGRDHRGFAGQLARELAGWVPRVQDHHIVGERLADYSYLRRNADG